MSSSPEADLKKRLQDIYTLSDKASSAGMLHYLQHVVIDSRPDPRPFRDKAEDWQWALNRRIAPALESVACLQAKKYEGPTGIWLTLPKGHDKSSMLARDVNWALAYNKRQFTGYVAAADREQAGYLAEAMANEARLNPWLSRRLRFKNQEITGAFGSVVKILAADAASTAGIRGDLLICDEVTRWSDREMYDEIKAGWRKRPGAILLVITNAGEQHSWCWDELQEAKHSTRWYVYEAPGRIAHWMDHEAQAEDRKTMPPAKARQLFDNVWVNPGDADGYVTLAEARACEELGRTLNLSYASIGKSDRSYVGAIDYGPVKDRTVLCIMHKETIADKEIAVIDKMDVWQGSRQNRVSVARVEQWIEENNHLFKFDALVVDPYQMESTLQKFKPRMRVETWEARGGKANYQMAQCMRSALINKSIAWYPGCGDINLNGKAHTFSDELCELLIQTMGYGWRVSHLPDKHDDRFAAVAMALVRLLDIVPRRRVLVGSNWW